MGEIRGIENYSEQYKAYGESIIENAKDTLNKAGIMVFPQKSEENKNTDSCVVINKKPEETVTKTEKKSNKKQNIQWIRESLSDSKDIMSLSGKLKNNSVNALANKTLIQQNSQNNESSQGQDEDKYDMYDVCDAEDDVNNVDTMSNASNDEGNGNPLQTFFEKSLNEGFSSNNFVGTNYEKVITSDTSNQDVSVYTDNLYHKNNISVIFGGTSNVSYNHVGDVEKSKKFDYNAYAFGKYKTQKITYGVGGIGAKNDGINNININLGAMHNQTGIFCIIQKDITIIPGLPTQTKTDINMGIGKESGLLNPDEYNKKDKSIEEISDIDQNAQAVEGKESGAFEINLDEAGKPSSTIVNLIISDTDAQKEYGIKAARILRHTTKKQNYSFIMPYLQVSNTNVDSNEGAKFILGTNLGQKAKIGQGWEIQTKGAVEASRSIMTGSRPSDYILANVNFKAHKNNFDGEVSVGGFYTNSNTYCKYAEAKIKYNASDNLTVNLKGGIADSKFDTDNTKLYQIAAGINYKF